VSVQQARVLWIESDPLSGGSYSQVEFPVELGPFFGAGGSPVIGDEIDIAISYAGIQYPAKKMDFHHNGVWRLNLPTAREGVGGYQGQILCFERTDQPDVYRLWKLDPGSPTVELLRDNTPAAQLGSTTRASGIPRVHGYF
jgi:hypothetical protein